MPILTSIQKTAAALAAPIPEIIPWCPVTEKEKAAILEVMERNELAGISTQEIHALETEWAAYLDLRHAILTNSGTAALHMAIHALGVQPGDEVIVPAYTFVATASAVLHHNAIPVFADIDPLTLCIDPAAIEKSITSKTKAIIAVHLNGHPAPMDQLLSICKKYKLHLIEDACQAHGAFYKGRLVGTFGGAAAFSLNKSKNLPAGEGGIFVCNNDNIHERANRLRKFGEVYDGDGKRCYNAFGMGWMYRSTDFTAALARQRIPYLDGWNQSRRCNVKLLNGILSGIPKLLTFPDFNLGLAAPWRYSFRIDGDAFSTKSELSAFRKKLITALLRNGIPVSEWQKMIVPRQLLFEQREGYGRGCPWSCCDSSIDYRLTTYPNAQKIVESSIWIKEGMQPCNNRETVGWIGAVIRRVFLETLKSN